MQPHREAAQGGASRVLVGLGGVEALKEVPPAAVHRHLALPLQEVRLVRLPSQQHPLTTCIWGELRQVEAIETIEFGGEGLRLGGHIMPSLCCGCHTPQRHPSEKHSTERLTNTDVELRHY